MIITDRNGDSECTIVSPFGAVTIIDDLFAGMGVSTFSVNFCFFRVLSSKALGLLNCFAHR